MVLARTVYDGGGMPVFQARTELTEERVAKLALYGVDELIIHDPLVDDVPVIPTIPPEVEAHASQALKMIVTECRGEESIPDMLVQVMEKPIFTMARGMFPEVLGEINSTGSSSPESYAHTRPVRVAGLAMLLARVNGMGLLELPTVGMAAALMDVGSVRLPDGAFEATDPIAFDTNDISDEVQHHPELGACLLQRSARLRPECIEAIRQHHERWDGSGYPNGLSEAQIGTAARAIAVADAFYEMVSKRSSRARSMPNEVAEFIMAGSISWFDPEMVATFVRQVPLYPTGVTVQVNTGEVGIVVDGNAGQIASAGGAHHHE
jgi:HD-GYP domain-containing protein (c-di-GMP phosphodiesterase class II)